MKASVVAAVLALALSAPTQAQQAAAPPAFAHLDMFALGHGGVNRSVGLYVPQTYRRERPAPLIIALHGRFSSAQAMHAMSHLAAVAERRGAILFYPETVGAYWNDGGFAALQRREPPQDDAGFINAAIDALAQDYAIDRGRIYVVGYDTGGALAYSMACTGAVHLAGVAVVSALMWDYAERACANGRATPMLIMHGDRDDFFPTGGGLPRGAPSSTGARLLNASATIDVWRRINGCGGGDMPDCTGAPLAYVEIQGGEHDWFHDGASYQLNKQGVEAADAIDRFFFDRAAFTPPRAHGSARVSRSWIVYAPPSYNPAHPTPVVILLHGRPSNGPAMAAISRMNEVAARHGFIVVYPEGFHHEWNAYYDLVRQPAIAPQDDIGFLKTLTEDLGIDFNIDRRRLYVGGFSNGGFMTLRLACSASSYFAAFASVSAELYTQLSSRCQGDPAPILLMHGTADPSVNYNGVVVRNGASQMPDMSMNPSGMSSMTRMGGDMGSGGMGGMGGMGIGGGPPGDNTTRITLSAFETASFFLRRNHCEPRGADTAFPESGRSPGTHVTRFAPYNCTAGDDVAFYVVDGGGHTWPGTAGVLDGLGATNLDINASEEIWSFFAAHALSHDPR
ncbi:MAG: dienelactone hydrolase family protein [Proteobacteria bacterium]|nr:dienelactone hydrolase family protein [Pseudomonadota bacterium]